MELKTIKKNVLREVKSIPRQFRSDRVTKDVIKAVLYQMIKEQGLIPVPSYQHPKFRDSFIDMIALDEKMTVIYSFAIDSVVTLQGVKGLNFLEDSERFFITYSRLEKKVNESKFFLSGGIKHINIF